MKVLVVGSGGREHALALKLSESHHQPELHFAPGNAGMDNLGQRLEIEATDIQGITLQARREKYDLIVVGPEAPLANGITDFLKREGFNVFGPNQQGAQLEASKNFAKQMMAKYNVPTAQYKYCDSKETALNALESFNPPYVIKEDGLAAGKGVTVTSDKSEAIAAIESAFDKKMTVVLEEFLKGEELSVLAICDGLRAVPMISAQDFKRLGENNEGPNTGGMGAYAPVPLATQAVLERVQNDVLTPMMTGLRAEGIDYRGVLYAGLMIDGESNPNVVEFNVRFGDPETQVVLPLLDDDLIDVMMASVRGDLSAYESGFRFKGQSAVTVVLVSEGYPGSYLKGHKIEIPMELAEGTQVIHAGTKKMPDGSLVTNGGRVINCVAQAESLEAAREKALQLADAVQFEGKFYRTDIAKVPVTVN